MIVQENEEADEDWEQIIDRYKEVDNTNRELEELSSSTLSSSSSSSLASSEISLSTNSSTSTVLAALNCLHHQTSSTDYNHNSNNNSNNTHKSMIARYSAIAKKNYPKKSEEEEDDSNQALSSTSSSSSSSSSSSGLSSMNSASNNSQEGLSLILGQNKPQLVSNRYNYCEKDEIEVKHCLSQLIDSVVDQADNEIEYKTFQLHEAILAQTTSGSSDESGSPIQQSQQTIDISSIESLAEYVDEVYLVRRFKINEPLTDSLILHLSRQCISQALKQQNGSRENTWLVAMRPKKYSIEWHQSRGNLTESVGTEKIVNCLVQKQLLVWLIDHKNTENEELETTLDDIALALDEPIGQIDSSDQVLANISKSFQAAAAQKNESNRISSEIEAIVWLFKSEEKAICFRDMFKSMEIAADKKQTTTLDSNNNNNNQDNDQQTFGSDSIDDQLAETTNDLVSANQFKHQQQVKFVNQLSNSSNNKKVQQQQTKVSKEKVNVSSANDHQQRQCNHRHQQQLLETPVSSLHANNDKMESLGTMPKVSSTIKKSSSGIDLSQQRASGLTSYYRNVANRVISNGQSKIRNFKDEMVKLNNRATTTSLASSSSNSSLSSSNGNNNNLLQPSYATASSSTSSSSSKRISLAVSRSNNRFSSSNVLNQQVGGNKLSSSSSVRNLTQDNVSDSKAIIHLDSPDTIDHQHRLISKSTSNLPLATQQTIPTVKPRTSILKNRQQNNGCDNNNNTQLKRQTISNKVFTEGSTINNKPKSILKPSKSVSNIVVEKQQQSENPIENVQKQLISLNKREQNRNSNDKRRSTHSMIGESTTSNVKSLNTYYFDHEGGENDDDYQNDIDRREQAFERLRQRASCYDISRLMSKNGFQNQLNKLRSGSTNSVTSKSRQRRPALLLDETDKQSESNQIVEKDHHDKENNRIKSRETDDCETSRFATSIKTTISGPDGMVHAQVNDYHLTQQHRSSPSSQGGRRQQQQQQSRSSVVIKTSQDSSSKKSEFDPRSLKRVTSIRINGKETSKDVKQTSTVQQDVKQDAVSSGSSSNEEESSTEDESSRPVTSSSLSKSGPFSLLRQSFNQKTLSSMLKFSGRASLRIKQPTNEPTSESSSTSDKSSAIAIAEANLLAAKQLKQQAQKLKEQQKREQQQQQQLQQQHLDPSIMLAAVQYNQQIQRQQQHQIMYQQYAIASRGQMFDASSVHMQHQMLIQRQQQQQQQQLAYMANLNSAHYMAQQMAVISPQTPMIPMPTMAAQQLMYVQPTPVQQIQAQQVQPASSGLFKKSILKGNNRNMQPPSSMMYNHHATTNHHHQQQQQLIPMAVNHHSSFNIVYGASSSTSQIPQMQQQQHQGNQIYEKEPATQQDSSLRKHSSLGASMRKTVKSILINRSSFKSSANNSSQDNNDKSSIETKKPELKLKSALKTSNSRDLVLNSEGSDGDGSSSDSTTVGGQVDTVKSTPKSALKKTLNHREMLSSSSSDSSCSSANGNEHDNSQLYDNDAKAMDYKQGVKLYKDDADQFQKNSSLRASKRKAVSSNVRKNVTFSAKLTSIL